MYGKSQCYLISTVEISWHIRRHFAEIDAMLAVVIWVIKLIGNRDSRFDGFIFDHFLMAPENRVNKVTLALAADDE